MPLWVDAVRRMRNRMPVAAPSEGIHIVLPASRLPLRNISHDDRRRALDLAIPQRDVVFIGDGHHHGMACRSGPISRAATSGRLSCPRYLSMDALTAAMSPPVTPAAACRTPGKKPAISRAATKCANNGGRRRRQVDGVSADHRRVLESVASTDRKRDAEETPPPGGDFDGDWNAARSLVQGVSEPAARLYGCEAPAVARLTRQWYLMPLISGGSTGRCTRRAART
jgi:hypothetical protein